MTALTEFSRLESGGLWRASPDNQRREVTVSLGNATLVILDSADRPLTHWSLPAVERMNAGERPALYTPAADGTETLEISDDLMISAMEKVRKTVNSRRYRPGRLRNLGLLVTTAIMMGITVFWLPNALIREAQNVVPSVQRAEIGATLLGHIQRITGQTCRNPLGTQALEVLHTRALGPDAGGQVFVVPSGPDTAIYLPGGLIVINRDLIEDTEDPSAVGGHIIAAAAQLRIQDPLEALLKNSGIRTTFTLLTQGEIAPEALRNYAETLFANPPQRVNDTILLEMFTNAQLPTTPYAFAVDVTGETTLNLIEADPMQGRPVREMLTDTEWISLQGICTK